MEKYSFFFSVLSQFPSITCCQLSSPSPGAQHFSLLLTLTASPFGSSSAAALPWLCFHLSYIGTCDRSFFKKLHAYHPGRILEQIRKLRIVSVGMNILVKNVELFCKKASVYHPACCFSPAWRLQYLLSSPPPTSSNCSSRGCGYCCYFITNFYFSVIPLCFQQRAILRFSGCFPILLHFSTGMMFKSCCSQAASMQLLASHAPLAF